MVELSKPSSKSTVAERVRKHRAREAGSPCITYVHGVPFGLHCDTMAKYPPGHPDWIGFYEMLPDSCLIQNRNRAKKLPLGEETITAFPNGTVTIHKAIALMDIAEFWDTVKDPSVVVMKLHATLPDWKIFHPIMRFFKGTTIQTRWGVIKPGDCSHPDHVEVEFNSQLLWRMRDQKRDIKRAIRETLGKIFHYLDDLLSRLHSNVTRIASMVSRQCTKPMGISSPPHGENGSPTNQPENSQVRESISIHSQTKMYQNKAYPSEHHENELSCSDGMVVLNQP